MTLHIFNPEHDIALAANLENFTAPHAGRQLRHDLGFLPAIWAAADDLVLVDDIETAKASLQRFALAAKKRLGISIKNEAQWLCGKSCPPASGAMAAVSCVSPWGWDPALRARLRRMGIADVILPGDERLRQTRLLSHRRTAAQLLGLLQADGLDALTGETPAECTTMEEVEHALERHSRNVLKAPWSSSGRGVRFVGVSLQAEAQTGQEPAPPLSDQSLQGWLRNVLRRQGSIIVEPCYNKVKDIGMEFEAKADGSVDYCGLSLFHTANGAYTGNILATERTKREMTGRYLPLQLIDRVSQRVRQHLATIIQGRYCGPIGVDMMICPRKDDGQTAQEGQDRQGFLLHPCVEINLRRTMGHVALTLQPADDDITCVMRIEQGTMRIAPTTGPHSPTPQ